MAVLSFGQTREENWLVARWVFVGYLNLVKARMKDCQDLVFVLDQATALDGLHLPLLEQGVLSALVPYLKRVAIDIVEGRALVEREGEVLDQASQDQFRRAVAELALMIDRFMT